ncbi:type II toxin-antitoxin system death-on-curing family toxin [Rhodoferax sp.]|uniref:type II toxin-antitoxin system death-on-curing family toxin n=1 Tax=Rhodoferax sp. TaxID=50421 RepID=UPI002768FCC7|nr:type II toxin-antitoxin system death-on-curing family toxin [Rhodoferax sp.]
MSWRWITKSALLLLHGESLAEHGGGAGLRDEGLLDSALAKPLNVLAYADPGHPPDLATLAASYCFGLAKNHAFVDGNKRAAFLAAGLLLHLNGHRLVTTQADATQTMLGVAAGDVTEAAFAAWLRQRLAPRACKLRAVRV